MMIRLLKECAGSKQKLAVGQWPFYFNAIASLVVRESSFEAGWLLLTLSSLNIQVTDVFMKRILITKS